MPDQMDTNWKWLAVRMVEALRWPVAVVVIFFLLREPIGRFISSIAHLGSS